MSSVVIAEFPVAGVVVEWKKGASYLIGRAATGEYVTRNDRKAALVCGAEWSANVMLVMEKKT